MENSGKEWYLGFDIGTNSVGFCATDTEYNILTKNGKLQCGARLFEEAQDASTRRTFRSTRRRMARRKVRIDLLQELFKGAMEKKDESFFIRLNKSSLTPEDRGTKYPLFNDAAFTDKDYYGKFPTVYHLREHLLENDENDVRKLYLACHHLIKYRGHFLFPNFKPERTDGNYREILERINQSLGVEFCLDRIAEIPAILKDKSKSNSWQFDDDVQKLLNPDGDKHLKNIFDAMRGNKIKLAEIFDDELSEREKDLKDQLKDFKFSVAPEKYEECLAAAEPILSEERLETLEAMKEFYDLVQLDRVMAGQSSIAGAMVERYKEHREDLTQLKNFIRENLPEEYGMMFRRKSQNATYVNYIGSNLQHNRKIISHHSMCVDKKKTNEDPMTATYEDFLKYTDKLLEKFNDKTGYSELKAKIEDKTLCRIQTTSENSYIPHQLTEAELWAILERQKRNFPFLAETDKYGSVADKIVSLLTFRIPYYVGPLNDQHNGKFGWIVKKPGKITPWNFDEMVDDGACGEKFINNLTSQCTYLRGEDVIPQQSLLYQKYMLLNDLNNLKINGNRIRHELKMLLYNGICQTETSLSKKKIKAYLVAQGKISSKDAVGKENENDEAFNSSLSSLIKLRAILGDKPNNEMCEKIILWHTVFGDEKKMVRKKLQDNYGAVLAPGQMDSLLKLNFKKWGRFSEKFLSGITAKDKNTDESKTIIQLLEETELNLMEILNSDNYCPKFDKVAQKSNAKIETIDPRFVEDLYCSPLVKRSIWQSILIAKELKKINGKPPKKVMIEVTRAEDKKQKGKMKSSRRKQLESLLKKAVKDGGDLTGLMNEFNKRTDEKEFRSERVYLYFTQLGKCMYTGATIDLGKLNNDQYDVDHIYPQCRILDNSLTNKVLVLRDANAKKGDRYPIDDAVRLKMRPYWEMLKKKELITAEKFDRLTSSKPLSDDVIGGFINRQLVSTNQAVKATAEALKALFGEDKTKIVYSKASNVSEFRHKAGLVKCREVNNLHHAHDAYLNIVVGNVWDSVFGEYWKNNHTFNEDRALERLFTVNRNGIWNTNYGGKIVKYLFDNRKYLGKYSVTTRPFEKKGAFYDQTIHPKGKGEYPLRKGSDPAKYGGYTSRYNAYNRLIEYDDKLTSVQIKKGETPKRLRKIIPVPVMPTSEAELLQEYPNAEVIIKKIPMMSVLEIDGVRYHMRSGDLQCSVESEWYPSREIIQIIHDIVKYLALVKDKQLSADEETREDIHFASRERNSKNKEGKVISRENNLKVYDAIIEQIKKPFYANYPTVKKIKAERITREQFAALKTYEQTQQLVQLLNLITMNAQTCDTSKIGGNKDDKTKYTMNNKISGVQAFLVTQSVTGMYEQRIPLNRELTPTVQKSETPDLFSSEF
ncbi:MAG: type II CRISPR RNA-guided endonuclease Cas9 [Victivallales bacterium]|jgi:CRISPR-associated endonuclease Csn1|nr:type II CRISPR RNA-guided endonuclease Cas9 [Victivallales bacterium]